MLQLLDPDDLPPALRLALAYAPAAARMPMAALFALDTRLSRAGGQSGEPLILQMKLAWWRDQLGKPAEQWPRGEPILDALAQTSIDPVALVALVDGWETLLVCEQMDLAVIEGFAEGRARAWQAVAGSLGCDEDTAPAARRWALADLAGQMPPGEGRAMVWSLAEPGRTYLPRLLRPLAVLDALAGRARRRDAALLDGPIGLALAMRVGIFGR